MSERLTNSTIAAIMFALLFSLTMIIMLRIQDSDGGHHYTEPMMAYIFFGGIIGVFIGSYLYQWWRGK